MQIPFFQTHPFIQVITLNDLSSNARSNPPKSMSQLRTFRVFISSTLADLKQERDALHGVVWPEPSRLCEKAGFRFQAIDLRWGISGEAGLDQQTSRMCRQELKRCQDISPRPYFIILLGNRYGWRPLPEAIETTEFEAIEKVAIETGAVGHQLLRQWYLPDENSIVRMGTEETSFAYYLRPHSRETSEADHEWWTTQVEARMSNLFRECVNALLPDDDVR